MKFSVKDFFSEYQKKQIFFTLKSLTENFIFV